MRAWSLDRPRLPPAVGGVVGPLAFVSAWAVLGAAAEDYDPTRDAISRLAALGAPSRPTMTAALVVLGGGMALYGLALRPHPAWLLPVANGATSLAVAALPLGGGYDTAHGIVATLGYGTLAAVPVVVGMRLPAPWRAVSVAAGVVSGACLLASVLVSRDGLLQRVGLTVAQLWVVVSALGLVRRPMSSSTTRPARAPGGRRR